MLKKCAAGANSTDDLRLVTRCYHQKIAAALSTDRVQAGLRRLVAWRFLCMDDSRTRVVRFLCCAPVAQLDRASGYEPEGREFESPRARHYLCLRPRKQKSNHPRSLFCSMNHGEESPVCASVLRTKLLPWASEPIQRSVASVRIVTISKPAIAH